MIVVSDTSSLCYLIILELVEILPTMYGSVIIPEAVWQELSDERSPEVVKRWVSQPPHWLRMEDSISPVDPMLNELGVGEQQAILLSEKLQANVLILDDREARQVASARGLAITGLLGLLDRAAALGLIDMVDTIERLEKTTFRVSKRLLASLVAKYSI